MADKNNGPNGISRREFTTRMGAAAAGLAVGGDLLSRAQAAPHVGNRILGANVRLGPWIHVESDIRNRAAIPPGSDLRVEGRVTDLFERGGHEFVDLDVGLFLSPDVPAMRARHRAIYRIREPQD